MKKVQLKVWELEDGRCEVCKRAMHREYNRTFKRKGYPSSETNAHHLVCIDCFRGQPDFLAAPIEISPKVLRELEEKSPVGLGEETIEEWFIKGLRRHGVILSSGKVTRKYWLPGVGSFYVSRNGKSRVIRSAHKIYPSPRLELKPQEKTRNLPQPVLKLS
ncbi:hypothetical protein [Mechercharimyces sp. CAU 1602]|uniref:hypothetical protein n=1 Tax=Mechercharimyces sp. CAU 1602 TaxID=2973933 RepID=UPI002161DFF0|nr:hypothetical protein [Mechercharimyces sp. CAU 1602]MCS1352422.1 hypothetical protein [Mechercharimyces sp. CAU 1602]